MLERPDVTFLYKFVDDLIGTLEPKIFDQFEKTITGNVKNLEVERTDETVDGSVTFLDKIVMKDGENGFFDKVVAKRV